MGAQRMGTHENKQTPCGAYEAFDRGDAESEMRNIDESIANRPFAA